MNEFKSDLDNETRVIEVEIIRIQAQMGQLKESMVNLTEIATRLNEI
jgi:hypothetical protein